jgi:DNA-binding response OmpR family regulator
MKSMLEGKRILIVDDEPDVLETLEEFLSMCRISKASSFDQARHLLESQEFDFAILDIMGVDGYKLLEIANSRNVISVMLTAHALSPADAARSQREGAASYVPKAKMSEIAGVLNDILEAQETGKSSWWRWHERFGSYFQDKFRDDWISSGEAWKEHQVMKWEKYFH